MFSSGSLNVKKFIRIKLLFLIFQMKKQFNKARPVASASRSSPSSAARPRMVKLTAGSAANKNVKKHDNLNKPHVKPARINEY